MAGASRATPWHPIAELYAHWALNPLVDIVHAIAHDVAVRPQQYKQLSRGTIATLNGFRFKLGSDAEWPNAYQRTLSFRVLYHVSLAGPALREAALLYRRRQDSANDGHLLDTVKEAAEGFRTRIEPLGGDALAMLAAQTTPIFEKAVAILRDPAVSRAFGGSPVPEKWPLGGEFSGDAAYLVAAVVRGLRESACLAGWYRRISRMTPAEQRLMPLLAVALPADKFVNLQKAAYYGGLTITRALVGGDSDDRELANLAYRWTKALQPLVPDAARAWKDLEYRARLTDLEWGMAPSPSGDSTPTVNTPLAFQTNTLHGEICCCSGDLDCDPTSKFTDFCSEYQCSPSISDYCIAGASAATNG